MKFHVYTDGRLPIELNDDFCEYLKEDVEDILNISVELIPKGKVSIPKTLTALRMGSCEREKEDIINCLRYNEYCFGAVNKIAKDSEENIIVFTKDSARPTSFFSDERGTGLDEGYGYTSIPDEKHDYAVILIKFSALTTKTGALAHEIVHAHGIHDCENEECFMNRNIVNQIRSSGLCEKCKGKLEEVTNSR